MRIAELKKEAYEFKRDIVVGAENFRTGKTMAENVIRYMEDKLRLKVRGACVAAFQCVFFAFLWRGMCRCFCVYFLSCMGILFWKCTCCVLLRVLLVSPNACLCYCALICLCMLVCRIL